VDYEPNPYHDHFRELPFLELKSHFDLNDQTVFVASCGTGIDIHYLRKHFANIECYASDISKDAVRVTTSAFGIDGSVEDNERLSLADDTFDYSFVAGSLHHLLRPHKGLYELLRVSRKGVIAIEPNDCWLTRLAARLGLATDFEQECGNYVFRYSRRDVEKIAKSAFCDYTVARMFATHRIARSRLEFWILRLVNAVANAVVPMWGNYIVFSITEKKPAT
jgi:ubiquinone/menaquinone biosynthesis C-methylase UbiE